MRGIWLTGLSILFVVLWSSGWTASHFVVTSSSALSVLTMRYLIVLVVLLVLVTMLGQWRKVSRYTVSVHLLIGALSHGLYLLGSVSAFELGVSAAVVAFINSLQPLVTVSFAKSITGELTHPRQRKGIVLGLLSAMLIVSASYQSGVSLVALGLPFLAMVAITISTMLNRRHAIKTSLANEPPTPIVMLMLIHTIGALLVILPLAAVNRELKLHFSVSEWQAILWLALVVSLLSYAIMQLLVRHVSAVQLSSLAYLVPPTTMVQSYLLFNNGVSISDAIAFCLAAGAVYLVLTSSNKIRDRKREPFHGAQPSPRQFNRIDPINKVSFGRPATVDIIL